MIPFNKPHVTGKEIKYISQAFSRGAISGNGHFTKKCHSFLQKRYGFPKVLLTSSCTDALEMCALLANIRPGDEVIVPSYTFVSTALAFVRQGAKVVFVDSRKDHPGINEELIEYHVNPRTKAIVIVHYAGVACNMEKVLSVAEKYNLLVIEDAAHSIDSFYNGKPLGSFGHLATFSFHETKNITSGEGGALIINDNSFLSRSEVIWEKGTNRAEFFRGEINKYGWVDTGSSFLPSDISAAVLFAQLEAIDEIQRKRVQIWEKYFSTLKSWAQRNNIEVPYIPAYATNNGHMFYLVCQSEKQRDHLISRLKKHNIMSVFHYLSLHKSAYYSKRFPVPTLENADKYSSCLLRLPLYYDLSDKDITHITNTITNTVF